MKQEKGGEGREMERDVNGRTTQFCTLTVDAALFSAVAEILVMPAILLSRYTDIDVYTTAQCA